MWILVLLIIILGCFWVFVEKECFAEETPVVIPNMFLPLLSYQQDRIKDATEKIDLTGKVNLAVGTIVEGLNGAIDFFNTLPEKIYDNCNIMSKSVGTKIQEYGETMRPYNKSKDDEEGLKDVTVNQRHKMFLDKLLEKDKNLYDVLRKYGDKIYVVPFKEQDAVIEEMVAELKLLKYNL